MREHIETRGARVEDTAQYHTRVRLLLTIRLNLTYPFYLSSCHSLSLLSLSLLSLSLFLSLAKRQKNNEESKKEKRELNEETEQAWTKQKINRERTQRRKRQTINKARKKNERVSPSGKFELYRQRNGERAALPSEKQGNKSFSVG